MDFGGLIYDRVGQEKRLSLDHVGIEEETGSDEVLEPNMTAQQTQHDDTIDNAEDSLSRVLRILNLNDKYPGKLTREDMYAITKSSLFDEQPKSHKDLGYYFIQKIVQYNYIAREFYIRRENNISSIPKTGQGCTYRQQMKQRAEENKGLEVSPMDITIAVFLCCDDICRQDLVKHMWSCRLAVPLAIQEQTLTKPPSFYLWPLRSLCMKWKMKIEGKERVRECRLVNEPMNSIAFIRLGTIGVSKSALINSVISPTEKTHSIFFHRDSPGSTEHRYLVNGLVDIGWYFPSLESGTTVSNHFQEAVVFLNLHGDASKLKIHVEMLSNLANIVTILCTAKDLLLCGDITKSCIDQGKAVLIVLTNHTIQEDEESTIESFIERHKVGESRLELMEVIDKQRADVVQETREILIKLSNGKSDIFNDIFKSDIYSDVDVKTDEFKRAIKKAKALSNLISKTHYTARKRLFLPLQEKLRNKNKIQSHIEQNERTMTECHSKELEILKQEENRTFIDKFLSSVIKLRRTGRVFLRWIHFEMDDLSKRDLERIYEKYHKIMQELDQANYTDREKLKAKLKDLDDKVELLSFGLEHVLREMRHVYLAPDTAGFDLPQLAAEILLDGYPFELMDGYENNDPLKWVVSVLKKVEHILAIRNGGKPVRIKVFAALGIQSSGKSTMLNALFGCQYAVSSGRCTRGVYCQFVKVEEKYKQELELDYILAIDTEGLRLPEHSASLQMVQHYNKLSAFAIGLADLTILNFMGESVMYLEKLIPISVQTCLRPNIATDLRPKKCLIVHQNVNKEDKQKLISQGNVLDEMLEEMTKLACKVKIIDTKSFQDIISFDVSTDVIYLPSQHEGSSPMSPINIRYSAELNVLKQTMLVSTKDRTSKTLESFRDLLQSLWSAIKKYDFDVQHQNALGPKGETKLENCSGVCDEFSKPNLSKLSEGQKPKSYEEKHKEKEAFPNVKLTGSFPIRKETKANPPVGMETLIRNFPRNIFRHMSSKQNKTDPSKDIQEPIILIQRPQCKPSSEQIIGSQTFLPKALSKIQEPFTSSGSNTKGEEKPSARVESPFNI